MIVAGPRVFVFCLAGKPAVRPGTGGGGATPGRFGNRRGQGWAQCHRRAGRCRFLAGSFHPGRRSGRATHPHLLIPQPRHIWHRQRGRSIRPCRRRARRAADFTQTHLGRPACNLRRRHRRTLMTVHFIGAGPGAADLLTLRGRDIIASCPVCLYAGSLVPEEILGHCPEGAKIVNTAPMDLDQIMAEIEAAHQSRSGRGAAAFRRPVRLVGDGRTDPAPERDGHPGQRHPRRALLCRRCRRVVGCRTDPARVWRNLSC